MRRVAIFAGLLLASLPALPTQAQVPLCLQLRADSDEQAGLEKLVRSEIGHHPTHRLVETGCRSTLAVELFRAGKQRYLTARIDQEIPVRFELGLDEALPDKLGQAISLALRNDPVYLAEDITRYSAVQRAFHGVLVGGHNAYRIELYQDVIFVAGSSDVAFASGGAFSVTRGSGNWQVFARVFAAGWPDPVIDERNVLRVTSGANLGLTWEASALAATTFYASAGVGLSFLRFEGPDPDSPAERASINIVRPTLDARVGVRFFRLYDFDLDLWAGAKLPWWQSDHVDTKLFGEHGAWTPSIQIGAGVGF